MDTPLPSLPKKEINHVFTNQIQHLHYTRHRKTTLQWAFQQDWDKLSGTAIIFSVLRSSSVQFFAPKTRNRGPQPVQDRPRYWGDRTGPPRTGLLWPTQPKKTSSDRFFGVIFVVPIEIIFISTIITLKIKRNI
jgi:hypothetical protein